MSPAIYIKSSTGFGNKIFDLISAIYLKNKYNTTIYFAVDHSAINSLNDPAFEDVFYKSNLKIDYISVKRFNELQAKLPINQHLINDISQLPEKITDNVNFTGLYRFAYLMYSSFNKEDKKLFDINPKLLNPKTREKYINKKFGCVHIRYGNKLCLALDDFKQTKYTSYMLPVYDPQYYIDQIGELLKKDLDEILIITDSSELTKKYILDYFMENPKIILYDSHYLDSFYLLTRALYIITSYSTFSFSAAYFNPLATCYLVKKYTIDPKKDYLYQDGVISPKWIIIDNRDYILNFNKELLKKMVIDYANCDKHLIQNSNQMGALPNVDSATIVNEVIYDNLVTTGPIAINNSSPI